MTNAKISYAFTIVISIVLFVGVFNHAMYERLSHDEHMYITASVMVQKYTLYKDFGYVQMPYLPLLYGLIYKLTGISYYLLLGRLSSLFFMALSMLLIYLISYHLSKEVFFSLFVLILFTLNQSVMYVTGFAWNSVMPITFSLAGYYLFVLNVSEKHLNRLGVFFSGFFLALATGTKLYYIATLPPFFIVSLVYPVSLSYRKRVTNVVFPFLIGVMIALLPAFFYLIKDAHNFIFDNFGYHIANYMWKKIVGWRTAMDFWSKLSIFKRIFCSPGNITTFKWLSSIFLTILIVSIKKVKVNLLNQVLKMESLLLILLVFFTAVAILINTPSQPQYFAMPLPFFIIMMACFICILPIEMKRARILFVCLIFLQVVFSGRFFIKDVDIGKLINIRDWTAISIHRTSEEILDSIGEIREGDKVATLSPLYIIEAGMPIYNELSSGPYLYRIGDLISDSKRKRIVGTSQNSLYNLFKKDPPKAIFVGFEGNLDSQFIKYAKENDYTKINKYFNGGTLYIRKDKY